MKITEAFEIILCLASENIISEREAQEDPEVLVPERERQLKALDMVHEYHRASFQKSGNETNHDASLTSRPGGV